MPELPCWCRVCHVCQTLGLCPKIVPVPKAEPEEKKEPTLFDEVESCPTIM